MDILLYLSELLETRKTVGIVGLGTLYKKKSPGKYDVGKHVFVPPSYNLAFVSEIKEQEELANFISEKRNLTIDSVNYYIGEFVERIQNELAERQEANLDSIGKLKLVNDEIILVSAQASKIGFEFYGLPEIAEPTKDNTQVDDIVSDVAENLSVETVEEENLGQGIEEPIAENVSINDEQEVYEEITEVQEPEKTDHQLNNSHPVIVETVEEEKLAPFEETPLAQPEEEYIEEKATKKGMSFLIKFLIAFLIIVMLGAIVYFVNPQFFNNYFNKNFGGKQEKVVLKAPIDSLTNQLDSPTNDSLAKNNDLIKLSIDPVATIDSTKVTVYEILVSAVATEKKANKIITNLAKNGISAKKIKLSKTMINISAGSFLKESEAKILRDSLRKKLKNDGIYIQPVLPKTHKK